MFLALASIALVSSTPAKSIEGKTNRLESSADPDEVSIPDETLLSVTYYDGRCVDFVSPPGSVAAVAFNKDSAGKLYWSFYLTSNSRRYLGSPVTVYMPSASVNGYAINPPYQRKTEESSYDFHASMLTYQFLVPFRGAQRLNAGDRLRMVWYISGSNRTSRGQATAGYFDLTCRV